MTAGTEDDGPAIQVAVERLQQLFHTLDPFPFNERDLDEGVEAYIVDWARELPRELPLRIVVHVPPEEAGTDTARGLEAALQHFFAYRSHVIGRDIKELFRTGRMALSVGLVALGLCLALGNLVAGRIGSEYLGRFIEEGLIIVGWVANWRPIEIFLYDWWPLARRRNLYTRLGAASVIVKPTPRRSR